MFTDAEKTDIRRFCGYGMFGSQGLPANGYRFSVQYGVLEYKLNNMTDSEESVTRTNYLANLYGMETDILGSAGVRSNLDTDQASVWTHNKNELGDRKQLFNSTRRMLCEFMGISPGPALGTGGLTLVV